MAPFLDARLKRALEEINAFIDQYVAKGFEYSKEHTLDSEMEKEEEKGRYVFLHGLARSKYGAEKI